MKSPFFLLVRTKGIWKFYSPSAPGIVTGTPAGGLDENWWRVPLCL